MTESRMGLLHEEWKEENDTMWKARSYVADSAGATVFEELIELRESEDGLYYIPTIQSENNGKPVRFKAVKIAANEVVFENQAHDYPQRILYLRRTDGNITAVIDGIKNGKELREEFHFRKEK